MYDTVCASLVGDTLKGFAGAVFAYGATGAGKTHTMTGLMTRALNHLFTSINESDLPSSYEVIKIYTLHYKDFFRNSVSNAICGNIDRSQFF